MAKFGKLNDAKLMLKLILENDRTKVAEEVGGLKLNCF